jgi:glycosyltransferase involved in cell wall biosynthesis
VRILILTDYYPPDKVGGVGTIAESLADAYRALGHTVFVLTTGERRGDEAWRGVVRGSRWLAWGVLTNNVRALRLIRRERISLVHLHQSGTTLFLLARPFMDAFPFAMTSLQVSYLSEARAMRPARIAGRVFRPRPGEYVERFLLAPAHVVLDFIGYALADRVTVVSRHNREELIENFGRARPKRIDVVPNGVAPPPKQSGEFHDRAVEARVRGRVVLTYIGVFRIRKRVPTLLLAMRELIRSCPDVVLLLVGGGRGYDDAWRALAKEMGIGEHVVFTGPVSGARVPYYLSLTDVFCLVSSYEGMPMALLEAMRAGKAVVASDGYGMRDLLKDGDAGILVPADDVPATVGALEALVLDRARRESLGRNAKARVEARFGWPSIAREYLRLVEQA